MKARGKALSKAKRVAPGSKELNAESTESAKISSLVIPLFQSFTVITFLSRGDAPHSARRLPLAVISRAFGAYHSLTESCQIEVEIVSNYKSRHTARLTDRLLVDRIVLLTEAIDDEVAHYLLAQLLFLMDQDSKQPISLYIDSPGGSVALSLGIVDTIVEASTPVHTTCVGIAAGTALLILACGSKGKRLALPHTEMQMTQLSLEPSSQLYGSETRLELKRLEDLIVTRLVDYSSEAEQKIRRDMENEMVFDAYEATRYGLIDGIAKVCS